MIPFPVVRETRLERIQASTMPFPIMQGIDDHGRYFLCQKVWYNGERRIGFIIEVPDTNEWEYGVLERLDIWRNHLL